MNDYERILEIEATRWNPLEGHRLAPAWQAAAKVLDNEDWHPWHSVILPMLEASDVRFATAANLLYTAISLGLLERTGEYTRGTRRHQARDTRMIRLPETARQLRPDLWV